MRYIVDNLYGLLKKYNLDSQLEENVKIYKYGIELLVSSMLGFLIVMFEGIIMKIPLEAIIFCISFTSLRIYAGGYHAETYLKCNTLFAVCCFLSFLFYKRTFIYVNWYWIVVIGFGNMLILSKYAPIVNVNKVLNKLRKTKCRKKFKIILSLLLAFLAIAYKVNYSPGIIIIYAIILVDILIFVVIGGKKSGKKPDCKKNFGAVRQNY